MKLKSGAAVFLLAAAVWALSRLPHPAVDIARLEPVETVLLTRMENGIQVETDSGDWGTGDTLAGAVEHLKRASSGEVFLETADKILLNGDMTPYWEEIWQMFRPASQVCRVSGETDLAAAAEYLTIHKAELTLGKLRGGLGTPEILIISEGRGLLVPGTE